MNNITRGKKAFFGRQSEMQYLLDIQQRNQAAILVVYGRRRVGKTELIEHTFQHKKVLKFEGIEGLAEPLQMKQVMISLAQYTNQPLLKEIAIDNWAQVFQHISDYTQSGEWIIYFEELQWLANYEAHFISYLKYAWDNHFRHNNQLLLILCGSAPSFMINHVLHSRALYNRSQYELNLQPFNLIETAALLKKFAHRDIMDAYLSVGGIPEYLLRIQGESSILLGLCKNAFLKNAYFADEYKRIFTSSLANNPHYQKIIAFLSKQKYASRQEIISHLKLKSGGGLTTLLTDLELSGFIEKYTPYNTDEDSRVTRYCISDTYLQFYFKFIQPIAKSVQQGTYTKNPLAALKTDVYYQWLGFAFERFCRHYHYVIADLLGFSAVQYRSGAFFNRAMLDESSGCQIDLIFDRADKVLTICEIKYYSAPTTTKIIPEFEKKLEWLRNDRRTIHKVLISAEGIDQALKNKAYFDRVLTLDDFFTERCY